MTKFDRRSPRFWNVLGAAALIGALALALVDLEGTPPLFWDEGWTLAVARNWVQHGHYGQLLDHDPQPVGLSAAVSVVAPIALSFRLFGIGIWQGRLFSVLFTLGSVGLVYYLTRRLYNRQVAWGAIAALLILPISEELNPILAGRQVFGEMHAIFYLLLGFVFFLVALERSFRWIIFAATAWGIALITKGQVPPFWLVSVLVLLTLSLINRWRRAAIYSLIALVGSPLIVLLIQWIQGQLMSNQLMPNPPVPGILGVTAVVPDIAVRKVALGRMLSFVFPTVIGVGYAAVKFAPSFVKPGQEDPNALIRAGLISLSGSWLAWYAFLAMAWMRYVFPPFFVGGIFVSAFLYDLTEGFSLRGIFKNLMGSFRSISQNGNWSRFVRGAGSLLALSWAAIAATMTALVMLVAFLNPSKPSASHVADYIDTRIAPTALIETYDSELFFLLDGRVHYPPDSVHVELIRRTFISPESPVAYDPLAADPDYLVVGPFSDYFDLYDPILDTQAFRLIKSFPSYGVYQRVRD